MEVRWLFECKATVRTCVRPTAHLDTCLHPYHPSAPRQDLPVDIVILSVSLIALLTRGCFCHASRWNKHCSCRFQLWSQPQRDRWRSRVFCDLFHASADSVHYTCWNWLERGPGQCKRATEQRRPFLQLQRVPKHLLLLPRVWRNCWRHPHHSHWSGV